MEHAKCKNCGACPTCGRGGNEYYGFQYPWPYNTQPYIPYIPGPIWIVPNPNWVNPTAPWFIDNTNTYTTTSTSITLT